MPDWSYDEILGAYAADFPTYERLAKKVTGLLDRSLAASGYLLAEVSGRAKEPDSFIKKAIRKGYIDPLTQTEDKVGVRIVIPFLRDREPVESTVGTVLDLRDRDDKRDGLGETQLGYLGVHFQGTLRPEHLGDDQDLANLEVELQIQTKAESAWAVAEHDTLYKAVLPVPPKVARRMTRLVALVEVFDDEVERFQVELAAQPAFHEMQAIVPPLETELARFSQKKPDLGLSALIIPSLVKLYDTDINQVYDTIIAPYVKEHIEDIAGLYASQKGDLRANPLLFQPEAFLIFERLTNDRFSLKEAWPAKLPIELLEQLSILRGIPFT